MDGAGTQAGCRRRQAVTAAGKADPWGAVCAPDVRRDPIGHGVLNALTFAAKDVFEVRGYTAGAGHPDWKRTHAPSARDAEAIVRLLRAGARLTGMTHTDELMYSLNGENYHYGTPVNPKAPEHIPGGSSSGSASAVAGELTDFAIGTDTGGSVRVPSAYCGIYGFRPTHGAVSEDGVIPLAPSFDTVGWMARDARTLEAVGAALLEQPDDAAPFRRAIMPLDACALLAPECEPTLLGLVRELAARADSQEETTLAPEGLEEWMRAFRILQASEIWRTHGAWIERVKPRFGPGIAERFAWASTVDDAASAAKTAMRSVIRERLVDVLGEDGVLVLPTTPGPAPRRGAGGEALERLRSRTLQLCCIAGLAGLPQATLPWGDVGGLPVGVSVVAGPGQDRRLLRWLRQIADERTQLT
ncbi:amidase [Paenibacillus sp.]|uniref:amidase n=1 Tax=Paenibacillus sp. TaxID=58172 RepID=UPI002D744C48|nr:amidase [Paenibacillus sp.]HZG87740.1 amidase [Paenibacillus sp.]